MGTWRWPTRSALVVTLLLLGGCSTSSGQQGDGDLTDEKSDVPAFFNDIPADTSYVATGLERVPADSEGAGRAQFGMSNRVIEMLRDEAFGSSNDQAAVFLDEFAKSLGNEMDGETLEANGMRADGYFAVYGYHMLPVYRWELADGGAFRDFLKRVEENAGIEPNTSERKGVGYRVYGDSAWKFVVTIRDGWAVGSLLHDELMDGYLPYLLGQESPDESLAGTRRIQRLAKRYDFEKWAVGYADIANILKTFIGATEADSKTQALLDVAGTVEDVPSETCRRELASAVDRVPRAVFGFDEYNDVKTRATFGVEVDEELASPMHEATTGVPAAESSLFEGATLALGFGIDVAAIREFLKEQATAVVEDPYECDDFQEWNAWAKRAKQQSVPPMISDLQGASLVLDGYTFPSGGNMPSSVRAMALVRSANPEEIVGRLQMRVPGLGSANLERDGTPVAIDQLSRMAPFLKAPHAAMTDSAFGMSVGEGMADVLADRISETAAGPEGEVAVVNYDLNKAYSKLPRQYQQQIDGLLGTSLGEQAVSGQFGLQFREEGVFASVTVNHESAESGSGEASGGGN